MTTQAREARAAGVLRFPDGFLWGAATAAYQVEGAVAEDGRRPSIWDTFSHAPGNVRNGDTGDVATDHYHRVAEDVALMRELGLDAYRFSVAWPRIQPEGSGPPNPRGLDFYRRLVDSLLAAEIEPVLTLYHWDLPQALEDAGGWSERETAYRFAEYAWEVFGALGDSVRYWLTLNEPWCSSFIGYGMGRHAPGIHDSQREFAAAHHLLLGHGLALEALRPAATPGTQLGIALNLETVRPASSGPADLAAARLADGMQIRFFLDPLFRGRYAPDVLEHLRSHVDVGYIREGDLALISAPIDVLGVNYYRPSVVGARRGAAGPTWTVWPGDEHVEAIRQDLPTTAMGWAVDETGLEELLARLREEYGTPPLLVTENGAAYDDRPDADGYVRDLERIDYIDRHLRAVHRAIEAGSDVRGYFVWSLMDNFEWAEGYARRFGLVYVDYETQRRVPKESARWYRQVIAANGPLEAAGG